MSALVAFLGTTLALFACAYVALLMFGADFAPAWVKSRGFLVVAGALIVVGSNAMI